MTATAAESRAEHWPRYALAVLLTGTAVLYLWNLSASGFGNTFYAAAAQAGARNWKAWFFGSLDAANFVTVDKPPAALWVTGLSVRLFGMNPWAVLAPQAVIGVVTVAVLYATVRRSIADPRLGAIAGLLAGTVLAVTPAAVLIFRFNNPDALLVLLMTLGAYCVTRATHTASWRWLALAGVALGLAFLTKMFAGLLVLPGFALAYLIFAPTELRKRLGHLMIAAASLTAAAAWWVVIVELWPTSSRPYISNSTDNSVLNLALGYNGMNRILGRSHDVPADAPALHYNSFGSHPSAFRLLTAEMGFEISWALPATIFLAGFAIYLWVRSALSRDEKAALVVWTGWMTVSGVVFTCMDGMAHAYYTVALAPAIGALVALGAVWAWRRGGRDGTAALAVSVALTAGWSVWLLHRAELGPSGLRWAIGLAGALAVVLLVTSQRAAVVVGVVAILAGVTTFGAASAATPHEGSTPVAVRVRGGWPPLSTRFDQLNERTPSLQNNAQLADALRDTHTLWSAATSGSQAAAALEIGSGTSVMAIGGWSKDPVPTLADFIDDVRAGRVTYYVVGGRPSAAPSAHEIQQWVGRHYQAEQIGGTKVYRLI